MGWFSLLAPFASLLFTAAKAWDVAVPLKDVSYAWAILPILIWVLIAYYRRWEASDRLTELLEPRITLGFDSEKCVRDVYFSNGELARYVGVIVTGPKEVSISNVSVFLHSVEYIDEDNRSTRIDIEGAPVLELTRSGGPVVAHNPKTLHAGREAQVNVLNCTSSPYRQIFTFVRQSN